MTNTFTTMFYDWYVKQMGFTYADMAKALEINEQSARNKVGRNSLSWDEGIALIISTGNYFNIKNRDSEKNMNDIWSSMTEDQKQFCATMVGLAVTDKEEE